MSDLYRALPWAVTSRSNVKSFAEVMLVNGLYLGIILGIVAFIMTIGVLLAFRVMG